MRVIVAYDKTPEELPLAVEMSQKELANKLKVSEGTISRSLNGITESRNFSVKIVELDKEEKND